MMGQAEIRGVPLHSGEGRLFIGLAAQLSSVVFSGVCTEMFPLFAQPEPGGGRKPSQKCHRYNRDGSNCHTVPARQFAQAVQIARGASRDWLVPEIMGDVEG